MADAYAAYDVARLSLDGANASTTISDSLGHTFTANGTAQLDTSRWGRGSSSLVLDGTGTSNVTGAYSTDWNMGSGDFCVDLFFNCATAIGGTQTLLTISDDSVTAIYLGIFGNGTTGQYSTRAGVMIGAVKKELWAFSTYDVWGGSYQRRWHHVALTRASGVIYLWLDGQQVGASLAAAGALDTSGALTVRIGKAETVYLASGAFTGNIDCVRITKGHARYTAPFVPPVDSSFNTYSAYSTISESFTNTRHVYVDGETNVDAIIATVDLAITQLGWTVCGSKYLGERTRVYKVLNADATSYKYAVLLWETQRQQMVFTTCESWDNVTRVMTNEVWTCNRSVGRMGYAFNNCDIFIFGNTRYLGIMTYIHGSASPWSMVVEHEREAPEDTAAAGYPCWSLIDSATTFAINGGLSVNDGPAIPRTRDGATGGAAKKGYWTTFLSWFACGYSGVNTKLVDTSQTYLTSGSAYWQNVTHAWDVTKKLISSVRFLKISSTTPYSVVTQGRCFGIKISPPVGSPMDRVQLPIDANGFYASGGTVTDHWILPISIIRADVTTNLNFLSTGGGAQPSVNTSTSNTDRSRSVVFTGRHFYCATSTGVYKYNVETGVMSAVIATTQDCFGIAYDGRFVWAGGATNLFKIDTANSDAVTLGPATPLYDLCYDGMGAIYGVSRTSSTTPSTYRFDAQTMAQMHTTTLAARTTANYLTCIEHNGIDTAAIVFCNGTTAADLCIGYWGHGNVTMSNYALPTGYLGNQAGISWGCGEWHALWSANTGSTLYGMRIAPGTGTSNGNLFNALTAVSITAVAGQRIRFWRTATLQMIVPASSSTALAVQTSYAAPDSVGTAYQLTNVGGFATAKGANAFHFTGNSVLYSEGTDAIHYYLRDLFRSTYSSWNNGHVLIPK